MILNILGQEDQSIPRNEETLLQQMKGEKFVFDQPTETVRIYLFVAKLNFLLNVEDQYVQPVQKNFFGYKNI